MILNGQKPNVKIRSTAVFLISIFLIPFCRNNRWRSNSKCENNTEDGLGIYREVVLDKTNLSMMHKLNMLKQAV